MAVIRGTGFPWVASILGSAIVAWQLFTGTMINLRWQPWIIRREQPRKFSIAFAVEALVVVVSVSVGLMTMGR